MAFVESFPVIAATGCHTLVLGSMPGVASLLKGQYYAHPRNAFWPIMTELLAIDAQAEYATRVAALADAGFALWDVLKACIRPGSLDSAIEAASVVPNDIASLLGQHRDIRRICFNGGKSAQLFRRHIQPSLAAIDPPLEYLALPSTSPAFAGMPYPEKLRAWSALVPGKNREGTIALTT